MNNFSIFRAAFSFACLLALATVSSLIAQTADQTQAATNAPNQAQTKQTPPAATADEAQKGERLVSLVLLLSAPRKPSHELIAHAVGEGLGTKIATDAVVTKPPYHLVNVGSDRFIINDIGQPYFEKSADVADEIKNPNLSRAVRDHRAWISVDWVSTEQKVDLRKIYQMIGKMVAHLSGKDTLAVYSPDMDQFALWAPSVRQGLESDDPLAVFEPAEPNLPAQAAPVSSAPTASP
jgi:hypothetical protein